MASEVAVGSTGKARTVLFALLAFAALALVPLGMAQAQSPSASLTRVQVSANKSQTVRLDYAFTDVLVGSSEIAEVIPLSDRTLYVLGKRVGTTNISVLDGSKRLVGVIDVNVTLDTPSVAAQVQQGTGSRGLQVRSSGDKVVLSGEAEDAQTLDRAYSIANTLVPNGVVNAARVTSPQQVMLQVRILEVARTAGRDLGIRWGYQGNTNGVTIGRIGNPVIVGNRIDLAAVAPISGAAPIANALKSIAGNGWNLDVLISAMEEQGLVRRLAEPNLIAMSGETADFLAGGEFPVPVSSTTTGGFPTVTIQYKEFGVSLSFTPTVLAGGVINLRVKPEVSDLDYNLTVQTAGVTVPGIVKRRANTTLELRDGQSFAIAGLIQAQSGRNVEQVPWLGSVPVLGTLFKSQSFQQRETELVVLVTPNLVKPAKPGQPLESPLDTRMRANDLDAFGANKMDVKRPGAPGATPLQEYIAVNGSARGAYGHMVRSTTQRAP